MTDPIPSGDVNIEGDAHARDIITGIQQNFTIIFQQPFQPPPNLTRLRAEYLAYLRDCYRHLDMKGILQVQQVTQQLSLAAVYVPLKATASQSGEVMHRVAGRWLHLAEGKAEQVAGEARLAMAELAGEGGNYPGQVEPQLIEESLKTDPAVVVLGDPGAGKSTLLKVLALALAEQGEGPLPILLPLNAYARRLQKDEVNLCRFLGEYYAGRQEKLKDVGQLFAHALDKGQAVILLDGLDEVQANRPHLVRLVQDFVAEYAPDPSVGHDPLVGRELAASPDALPVPGNRVVVTSRIVGYNEAPLAGRKWRTHTLTDFDRNDIEQFISQWTLAFALSVQGDTEPARQAAAREQQELLDAIFSRSSVERLAANPLLLTILALIKYTGVTLPEQRVKLYELYLEALIESWNLARSLDQYPVGPGINYEETVQVLAPLALWLRQENPTAGLVSRNQLETWLTAYYHGEEWGLPKGEARQRGRDFITSVERYSNLLLERGEGQYGFLHLTLEEMLAAKGIAQLADDGMDQALAIFERYLTDPGWNETLQLAVGVMGVVQQRPKAAGAILKRLLEITTVDAPGRPVTFAGESLLDVTQTGVSRPAAEAVKAALVNTMQSAACSVRTRRDAGNLLGRLDWVPEPEPDDLLLVPAGVEPTGLDAFRPIQTSRVSGEPVGSHTLEVSPVWLGKYPVTNRQFARFMADNGYERREFWSEDGWAWRTGTYDSKATEKWLQDWLTNRPPEERNQPYYWTVRKWNSPLYPVVGVSWFEAEAYCRWLTAVSQQPSAISGQWQARLPQEAEWEAAMGGRGEYPWGDDFDPTCLNCAEGWFGRSFKDDEEWRKWLGSDTETWREAGVTAVVSYPQGVSYAGLWDGSGNVWEWQLDIFDPKLGTRALRGGSWSGNLRNARVSYRLDSRPDYFSVDIGFRVVVAPV
jgi:formylglycine-generating enzyme required for sulfatase activity/energy-coupling factor transporter ATP-binding protein EcfA2